MSKESFKLPVFLSHLWSKFSKTPLPQMTEEFLLFDLSDRTPKPILILASIAFL